MFFAIIPFEDPPQDFIERINKIDSNPYISLEPHIYFIQSNGNTSYVSKHIGFTNDDEYPQITGIVIPCGKRYSGFATPDLWGYLKEAK